MNQEFYHEHCQKMVDYYKQQIKEYQAELQKPGHVLYGDLWQLAQIIKDLNKGTVTIYWQSKEISFYIKKVTIEEFDEIFSTINQEMAELGYELVIDDKKDYSYQHTVRDEKITLEINSTICRQVKTGKMIPEVKEDCNFIIE